MTTIEQIKAEIERRTKELDEQIVDIYDSKAVLRKDELQRLLSFLSALEKSEKPMNLEGLEKEIEEYFPESTFNTGFNYDDLQEIARHFAKWGAEHTPLPEDTVIYQKGVEEGKRLMMEEAVEADVNIYRDIVAGKSWAEFVVEMPINNLGNKVCIIIVKED